MMNGLSFERLFATDLDSIIEIFVRGSIVYLVLLVFLRLIRRGPGAVGITDLLVVVMIADAAQNAMAGGYETITEGVMLVATIIGWDYGLDYLGSRVPAVQRLLRPPPKPLIVDGRMHRANMRGEMITEEELRGLLREQGVEEVEEVKQACLEGDGQLSVIKKEPEDEVSGKAGKKKKAIG
jgi:uncharacterized membrane protein YcaP (DUF421 family)